MDLHKMIAELESERDRLSHAILALERLSRGLNGSKRGRPPKWLRELTNEVEDSEQPAKHQTSGKNQRS